MPITEEQLAKTKAEHPGVELHLLSNPDTDDQIICKGPNEGEWKRFKEKSGTTVPEQLAAARTLVVSCLVYPSKEDFVALVQQRPGLPETFAGELTEIAGISRKATHRKL
jgi:hypothetical protein